MSVEQNRIFRISISIDAFHKFSESRSTFRLLSISLLRAEPVILKQLSLLLLNHIKILMKLALISGQGVCYGTNYTIHSMQNSQIMLLKYFLS